MTALPLETGPLNLDHSTLYPKPPSLSDTPAAILTCVLGHRLLQNAVLPANMLARTCSTLQSQSTIHPLLAAIIDEPDVVQFRLRLHRMLLRLQTPRARFDAIYAHHLTRRLGELCLDAERLVAPMFIMALNIQTEALQAAQLELEQAEILDVPHDIEDD